ncbi:ketohexokinase-like [Bacillus rossius redtenbacheri]|uniref:ketohexokinase-like n=1 Tax=Bacillus rossius redtenbacheri TaxID=93214 RepID=UPI002FDD5DA5
MPYFIERSQPRSAGGKVLCVGLACLDSVYILRQYPIEEDVKEMALQHRWQRGGNASNSATVLALLGADCEFFGTLSGKKSASFIVDNFTAHGISTQHCPLYDDCEAPAATVLVNNSNGLRTIIHNESDLPELDLEDFRRLDLSQYSWVHFEGRNVVAVARMVEEVAKWNRRHAEGGRLVRVSVELERPRCCSDVLALASLADVVFVSKDYAAMKGWPSMEAALEAVSRHTKPSASIIVTWGEEGAACRSPDGSVRRSPGHPPPRVVETLGAGDTFLAAAVFSLNQGHSLQHATSFACRIAGAKVGMYGYSGLRKVYRELLDGLRPTAYLAR